MRAKPLHGKNFFMANSTNLEDPVEGTKRNSTAAVEDALLEESALEKSDSLLSVLTSLNQNMDHMAGSLTAMGEAFTASSKQRPAKRDARSGNLDPLKGKTKKSRSRVAVSDTKENSSESDDADVHELLATNAENDSEGAKTSSANSQGSCKNEGEDELLKKFALDFSTDDKVSRPISKQLAEIINKRWASKLGENEVKETVEKYDRPENCEKLVASKVNPEIYEKLTHYGKKQDLRLSAMQNMTVKVGVIIAQSSQKLMEFRGQGAQGGKLDTGALLTAQIDAIALLAHTNYELSLRRQEAIKPNLNKEYGWLCSSQSPVTTLLFGDELQSQLTAIRASNRISHTAVHNSSKSSTRPPYRQKQNQPFLGKGHFQSRWRPQKTWRKKEETSKK